MTEMKKLMFDMKNLWGKGEFDSFYDQVCMEARANDIFDIINIEVYIFQAIQSQTYENPDTKGIGSVVLGFLYGSILTEQLARGKWVFNPNPKSWSDFYISYHTKEGYTATLTPFSRISRFIEDCRQNGKAALKGENSLESLLVQAQAL